jgi:hypothetical protein
MKVELNHAIVWFVDKTRSAAFLADVLGRPGSTIWTVSGDRVGQRRIARFLRDGGFNRFSALCLPHRRAEL